MNNLSFQDQENKGKRVFVVHGRNIDARNAMFSFLRALSLEPIEWSVARQMTGKPNPYIGEILDSAFEIASAIVVLMSPDDVAMLQAPYQKDDDPEYEKQPTPQARPNVIFEAGMAMGKYPMRTLLVELGKLRPFSDIAGRHVVKLSNSVQARQELALRLKDAGCQVNLMGTDWYITGDFEKAINHETEEANISLRPKKSHDLDDVSLLIYKFVLDNPSGPPANKIYDHVQKHFGEIHYYRLTYYLDLLVQKELIYIGGTDYYPSEKGRKYAVEIGLI